MYLIIELNLKLCIKLSERVSPIGDPLPVVLILKIRPDNDKIICAILCADVISSVKTLSLTFVISRSDGMDIDRWDLPLQD